MSPPEPAKPATKPPSKQDWRSGQRRARPVGTSTAARKARYVEAYAALATTAHAAAHAGVSRSQAWRWQVADPKFAQAIQEAREANTERLEASAFQRAMEGDTALTIFLLKSRRPDIYRDRIDLRAAIDVSYRSQLDSAIAELLQEMQLGRPAGEAPPLTAVMDVPELPPGSDSQVPA